MSRQPNRSKAKAAVASMAIAAITAEGKMRDPALLPYDLLLLALSQASGKANLESNVVFVYTNGLHEWVIDALPIEGLSIAVHPGNQMTFCDGLASLCQPQFGAGMDGDLIIMLAFACSYAAQSGSDHYVIGRYIEERGKPYQVAWECVSARPLEDMWIRVSLDRSAWLESDLALYPGWE